MQRLAVRTSRLASFPGAVNYRGSTRTLIQLPYEWRGDVFHRQQTMTWSKQSKRSDMEDSGKNTIHTSLNYLSSFPVHLSRSLSSSNWECIPQILWKEPDPPHCAAVELARQEILERFRRECLVEA